MSLMEVKLYKCCRCKERKLVEDFYKDKSRTSGLQSRCKKCSHSESTLTRKIKNKLRKRLRDTVQGIRVSNEYTGCTGPALIEYIESQFKEGMTWGNHGWGPGKWVIDHIRPISNFLKTGDDIKKANHYTNLQPLWYEENQLKSDKF